MSRTPALYNSAELCKLFTYMECRRNKWDCKEGGGGGCFQVTSMIDLGQVKKDILCYVHDVRAAREMGRGLSDHHVKIGMGRRGSEIHGGEETVQIIWPLVSDDLVLCGKWEDLRVMFGRFVEVCRRRELKVNAGKSKVMVMNGE